MPQAQLATSEIGWGWHRDDAGTTFVQVVRADMKELRDLDLGGAPYGYTPFCDSRQDMEGYRCAPCIAWPLPAKRRNIVPVILFVEVSYLAERG